jgi:hypothetical protein
MLLSGRAETDLQDITERLYELADIEASLITAPAAVAQERPATAGTKVESKEQVGEEPAETGTTAVTGPMGIVTGVVEAVLPASRPPTTTGVGTQPQQKAGPVVGPIATAAAQRNAQECANRIHIGPISAKDIARVALKLMTADRNRAMVVALDVKRAPQAVIRIFGLLRVKVVDIA